MWYRWFPWKYLIRKTARKHGFLDPITLAMKLRRFAQPAAVSEPMELIRAGALFHARGLINTRAIQHNLDWVWPYWIEEQFNPKKTAFIPRAFSITHINLTHRDWTAVGMPGCDSFPIIDPRGLVTPFWDGWSIDAWIIPETGTPLLPSKAANAMQTCSIENGNLTVRTAISEGQKDLTSAVWMEVIDGLPVCRIQYNAESEQKARLIVSLRPCNPEGISLVHSVKFDSSRRSWRIEGKDCVKFSVAPERHFTSRYRDGDVFNNMHDTSPSDSRTCNVGLTTAAAAFDLAPRNKRCLEIMIDLAAEPKTNYRKKCLHVKTWKETLKNAARISVPDKKIEQLYNNAVRTLVLMSPDWAYPGPYTYKRFWYRDAVFMIHGLLGANLLEQAENIIAKFPEKQTISGFFHSQEGEWDANGEVLWIMARFCEITGKPLPNQSWRKALRMGGEWIIRHRLTKAKDQLHKGLLPAGFSAEHFGNIDYYYWDDFWAVSGLREAAKLIENEDPRRAGKWRQAAEELWQDIWTSLEKSKHIRNAEALPASPYRRMDSGSVGSLIASYPLSLVPPDCPEVLGTVEYLLENSFVDGAFFQDMIHSGMNAYLSLHVAQVLLRNGDSRFFEIVKTVCGLASPTGNWPEAIHPATKGGCMGDGQHAWAAAEWLAMVRNMFVLEEGNRLILGAGIPTEWLQDIKETIFFGPTPTKFGNITVKITFTEGKPALEWEAEWHESEPEIEIRI